MSKDKPTPPAIQAAEVPPRNRPSVYPEPFAAKVKNRKKRQLGNFFGLQNFGVNHTTLEPGASSALRHCHTKQDEFVYILQGHPTLYTDEGPTPLSPGMCAGFRAGNGNAHHLVNESAEDVVYLEIGDRTKGDGATYPDEDLQVELIDGKWVFSHKDGTPY